MEHSEEKITQLLRTKYSGQHWAFVSQVPNGTGMNKSRTCDGMAMGLWESQGLHLHGFEIKVSRSDWLSELQIPEKAIAFSRYCHFWWIVAPPGIVKPEEVAGGWGIQEVTKAGDGLRVKKAASLLSPEKVGPEFLAGLFRTVERQSSEVDLQAARSEGYDAGRKNGLKDAKQYAKTDTARFKREAEKLQRNLDAFEEASGISIGMYRGGQLGELVATARKIDNADTALANIRWRLESTLTALDSS